MSLPKPFLIYVAAAALVTCGCSKIDLYTDLEEREANEMMSILLERGIDCTKQSNGKEPTWKLQVGSDDFSNAVNLLRSTGYPNDRRQSIGEVFQKSGFVSSPTEDRIRYVYALSEELAETISRIDGVVDARVHVVLPENDPFSKEVKPSSASVYLKHRADRDLSAAQGEIKDLVARGIEGLESDHIEVFMDEVEPLAAPVPIERAYATVLGMRIESRSVWKFWTMTGVLLSLAVAGVGTSFWMGARGGLLPAFGRFKGNASGGTVPVQPAKAMS